MAVLVLADVPFASVPQPVQDGLVEYVNSGGALLVLTIAAPMCSKAIDAARRASETEKEMDCARCIL